MHKVQKTSLMFPHTYWYGHTLFGTGFYQLFYLHSPFIFNNFCFTQTRSISKQRNFLWFLPYLILEKKAIVENLKRINIRLKCKSASGTLRLALHFFSILTLLFGQCARRRLLGPIGTFFRLDFVSCLGWVLNFTSHKVSSCCRVLRRFGVVHDVCKFTK